jgi:hypothetical protein
MAQPEVYLGGADQLFDAHGKLTNDGTRKFLQDFLRTLAPGLRRTADNHERQTEECQTRGLPEAGAQVFEREDRNDPPRFETGLPTAG